MCFLFHDFLIHIYLYFPSNPDIVALKWQGMSPKPTIRSSVEYNSAWILLLKLSSVKNYHPAQF